MVTFIALFVTSALGVLPGSPSKFEANDGNMIVNTAGNNDWASVAFTRVDDVESATNDDSFDPGQKQDTTCPDVAGHRNPPKDDFTDIAEFSETNTATGDTYLYGATIRVAANGNASENIELNQGISGTCPGSTLLARSAGDKLIAIDYVSGGPQFHVLTWVVSGACFVSNDTPPCWGATVLDLNPAITEGAVNASPIAAGDNPINNLALEAGQFAEFGVNLGAAGIIPPGSCKSFTQSVFESRSSGSSFVSTVKDISVSQRPINVCPKLIVKKVGSDGGSQAGAVFTLYKGSGTGGPVVGTCTVNADGNCVNDAAGSTFPPSFTDLPPGTYTLDETKVPSGYTKDPSMPQTFDLAASETKTITATDIKLASVIVKKVGSDGGSQAGAVFTLYAGPNTSGTVVGTCTVNAAGDCVNDAAGSTFPPSFKNLSPGTYTLDETTVPPNYVKDANMPVTFALAAGETKTITATDIRFPSLTVRKVGSDGGSQAGAVFTFYSGPNTSGTVVGTCTVNAAGECVNDAAGSTFPPSFKDLTPGTYTLDETKVPPGYAKDPNFPTTFTLAAGDTKTFTATNIKLANVIVKKVGSDGGSQAGAVFTLYSGPNTSGTVVGTCTVNAAGDCVNDAPGSSFPPSFKDLTPGTFTLDETTVPSGYAKDPSLPTTFTLASGDTKTFTATNIKLGNVIVKKVGSDGGSQAGAVFTLYSGPNTSGTVVGTCTVNAGGDCVNDAPGSGFPPSFKDLMPGTYTLDETTVPSGYAKDPSLPVTFALAGETKTFTFTNIKLSNLIVKKVGNDGGSQVGAVFTLYSGPNTSGTVVGTCTVNAGGDCVNDAPGSGFPPSFKDLMPGTYTLDETTVPIGYDKDPTLPVTFALAGETKTFTFTDIRRVGAIRILKNSTKTGNRVLTTGAAFSIGGSIVFDNGLGDSDSAIGAICVFPLDSGSYTVNEITPPQGYGAASESGLTAVAVTGTNCDTNPPSGSGVVTFTNPPLADIQVNFRDGGSGETSLSAPLACDNTTGTSSTDPATGWQKTLTVTGVHAGATTVVITCTIKIDP